MGNETFKLVELTAGMEAAFMEFSRSLGPQAEQDRWLFEYKGEPFEGLVAKLQDWKRGKQLPRGWVRSTVYYLVRNDGTILGKSSLRHLLNDFLRTIGGHIGYLIRSDQRRKGYGTVILRLTLEKAHQLGLRQVLVTCDEDNLASAKIIEANGGLLKDMYQDKDLPVPKRRYWIEL